MNLIKTSLLNGVAVLIKMATLLGINKILAIYAGPAGYAAAGQFQSVVQMTTAFAGGAINTGVTKYTAEYFDDPHLQREVWKTAGTISLIGSVLTATILIIFREPLAVELLNDAELSSIFIWLAAGLSFFVFNTLLLAILNGKREISRYVLANIAGSIISLIFAVLLTVQFKFYGALVALSVYQSAAFVTTLYLAYKTSWFNIANFFGKIDKKICANLLMFAAMGLTSAACLPVAQIIIREHLGISIGWNYAGYWEAMNRLSNAYLLFITTTLSIYFLPRLSELKLTAQIRGEILQGYKIIIPLSVVAGLLIFLLRDFIIKILFTEDFLPMRELFLWQLMGDTLKIGSWILAYLMISKAMIKSFIVLEISTVLIYVYLTIQFTDWIGIQGAVVAYAITYLIYWVLVTISVKQFLFFGKNHD